MNDIMERIAFTRKEVEHLKEKIRQKKISLYDTSLKKVANELEPLPHVDMKVRRTLKGHLAKIYAMHWTQFWIQRKNKTFIQASFQMQWS